MQHQEQAFGEPTADETKADDTADDTADGSTGDARSRWRRWGRPIVPGPRRIWLGGGAGTAAPEDELIPGGRGRDDQAGL